jgi:hypothetical protein
MQYAVSQSISVSVGFCLVSVSVLVFGRFTYGISLGITAETSRRLISVEPGMVLRNDICLIFLRWQKSVYVMSQL